MSTNIIRRYLIETTVPHPKTVFFKLAFPRSLAIRVRRILLTTVKVVTRGRFLDGVGFDLALRKRLRAGDFTSVRCVNAPRYSDERTRFFDAEFENFEVSDEDEWENIGWEDTLSQVSSRDENENENEDENEEDTILAEFQRYLDEARAETEAAKRSLARVLDKMRENGFSEADITAILVSARQEVDAAAEAETSEA